MRDDDVYDEDEVRHLLQTGSESEQENISTELGYDADSEETNFDESEKGMHLPVQLCSLSCWISVFLCCVIVIPWFVCL